MKGVWLATLFAQFLESSEIIGFYLALPELQDDASLGRCYRSHETATKNP